MTVPTGNTVANPLLSVAGDTIWRPASNSPLVKSSVGSYPFVEADMDGQIRASPFDVGADEIAVSPISRGPLKPSDVGPPAQLLPTSVHGEMHPASTRGSIRLESNYPNPFNPMTRISFSIPHTGKAVLRVYDQLGKEIATLLDDIVEGQSVHTVNFGASNYPSGVYYAQLQFDAGQSTRKMLLLR
jgi:hypothetical protein